MPLHPIIALVGPSGGGKSTLMDAVVAKLPQKVDRIVSFTTRPQRNEADFLYYEFIDRAEVERRKAQGVIVQLNEFNGNFYGTDKMHVDSVLKNKMGILALVEQAIELFTNRGYHVIVIKVEPKGYIPRPDRIAADKERSNVSIPINKTIVNDFSPGGFEKAVNELIDFIQFRPTA